MRLTYLTIAAIVSSLAFAVAHGPASQAPRTADGIVTVPFIIRVPAEHYRSLLERLPGMTIGLDEQAIVERIARGVAELEIEPPAGKTPERFARTLYHQQVRPALEARIETFNDTLNRQAKENRVSAGTLALAGLANAMAEISGRTIPEMHVHGVFSYQGDAPGESGQWDWNDQALTITGASRFDRSLNLVIEERIDLDLGPASGGKTIPLYFNCAGEVVIEQTYSFRRLGEESPPGKAVATVRLHPWADVKVTRRVSAGFGFTVEGGPAQSVDARVPHRAVHEVEVSATSPWR